MTGKGLDLGVRVEFENKVALKGLRDLGPDAKIMQRSSRTFCLNSPGEIYRYPMDGISIPGGIVADEAVNRANVGLLVRVENKTERLRRVMKYSTDNMTTLMAFSDHFKTSAPFSDNKEIICGLFGEDVLAELEEFSSSLSSLGLVDWTLPHKVHLPLIDWHWDVFCNKDSHATSLNNVFALGDSAGHARGLLQAALSGWIAAEEYLNAYAN